MPRRRCSRMRALRGAAKYAGGRVWTATRLPKPLHRDAVATASKMLVSLNELQCRALRHYIDAIAAMTRSES